MQTQTQVIYTIGHSTHSIDYFIQLLLYFSIQYLADIRSFPGSRKFPQFNKENLELSLHRSGIGYHHLKELGGRRKVKENSRNNRWHNDSFRGYADYMETEEFEKGMSQLTDTATRQTTAFMCSEALWWRCHRSMVSDYLKAKGWTVLHIMSTGRAVEHPYTSPALISGNLVRYSDY